jgi:DNA invertase Pin-like site-specific DNA recombinase
VALVAAYLRVSTTQQDWATQREAIRKAAKARGDVIRGPEWFEEKRSGVGPRSELGKVREGARRGEIRKLYVYAFDRLSRGGIAETLNVVRELRAHGCEVVSMLDGFDVAGPGGELALAVMAWAAEQERKRLRERMRDARARVEAEGGRWGRPRTLDPKTIAQARKLLASPGLFGPTSIREVAGKLKVSYATLQRALAQKGHYAKATKRRSKSAS